MKNTLLVIILLQLLWIFNGCKKKEEEKPYEPVKQSFTDIPGTDIQIITMDTTFVDSGMVVKVRGKGFDIKYRKNYVLKASRSTEENKTIELDALVYSYDTPPEDPQMISFADTAITYKFSKYHMGTIMRSCEHRYVKLGFYKYSDDGVKELDYKKRYLLEDQKPLFHNILYEIFQDTVYLPKTGYIPYFFNVAGITECVDIYLDGKYVGKLSDRLSLDNSYYSFKSTLPKKSENIQLTDGYHTIKLVKNNAMLLVEANNRTTVYFKNIK